MTITRSTGLHTGYGAYFCGNGYEGKTKELDDTVKRQAELLATTFNRDVEIRFNSNQESGGAWLKNSLEGFKGNCQVGFNSGLRPIGLNHTHDMPHEEYMRLWRELPKEIYIATYAKAEVLKDPSLANSGCEDSRYCYLIQPSIEKGLTWLIENIDTEKILD